MWICRGHFRRGDRVHLSSITWGCLTARNVPLLLSECLPREVDLKRALNTLHEPEENGDEKDEYRDPKCIPLDPVPAIEPPL